MTALSRRRFIAITAAAAGLAGLAGAPLAARAGARRVPLTVWRGTALGALASIRLHHPDRRAAEALIEACVADIGRLERVFSLYRPDSALSLLNAQGRLDAPPLDLVRLLAEARSYGDLTGGRFDVTVQPLWRLYAEHFSRPGSDPGGPPPEAVRRARDLVGYRDVEIAPDRISYRRAGMSATLNGIAQGYVTDRIADLLRRAGIEDVLLDLGEARGSGRRADGRAWRVGLADPREPERSARTLSLTDRALATSAAYGFAFDAAGTFHHLFDPKTGRSRSLHASVSVAAPEATAADALSTAFSLMEVGEIDRVLAARPGVTAYLAVRDGSWRTRGEGPAPS